MPFNRLFMLMTHSYISKRRCSVWKCSRFNSFSLFLYPNFEVSLLSNPHWNDHQISSASSLSPFNYLWECLLKYIENYAFCSNFFKCMFFFESPCVWCSTVVFPVQTNGEVSHGVLYITWSDYSENFNRPIFAEINFRGL